MPVGAVAPKDGFEHMKIMSEVLITAEGLTAVAVAENLGDAQCVDVQIYEDSS